LTPRSRLHTGRSLRAGRVATPVAGLTSTRGRERRAHKRLAILAEEHERTLPWGLPANRSDLVRVTEKITLSETEVGWSELITGMSTGLARPSG